MDGIVLITSGLIIALLVSAWALKSETDGPPSEAVAEAGNRTPTPAAETSQTHENWSWAGTLFLILGISAVAVGLWMDSTVSPTHFGVDRSERIINFDLMFQKFIIIFLGCIGTLMGLMCRAVGALLSK